MWGNPDCRFFFVWRPGWGIITKPWNYHMDEQPDARPRLIDFPAVEDITSLGKTKLYELIKAGELRPIKLGKKVAFSESEIFAWVQNKLDARGAA